MLKQSLSIEGLKSFLTNRHRNAGRERYRRAGLTASASFVSKALTIIISFVSVPLTVHYLGSERYGIWLTIGSLLTWMSMTDFGIAGNALVNLLADAHGKEDRELAGQHASSAFWTLVGLSLCIGAIFLFCFHLIPWPEVFHVSSAVPVSELNRACAYSLIFFLVGFPLSMVSSVYGAYQDGFLANIWNIAGSLLALISLIVVAQMKGGLPQLAPFISAYGEAKARADWEWIHRAFKTSLAASLTFGVPLTIAIALTAKALIRIWAGQAAVPTVPVILWLSVYTLICVGMLSVGQLFCGLGRADVLAYSLSLCALCTIALGVVFARWWGVGGVAFAMAISKFCTSSPIQLFKMRGILRANKAPALVAVEPSAARRLPYPETA